MIPVEGKSNFEVERRPLGMGLLVHSFIPDETRDRGYTKKTNKIIIPRGKGVILYTDNSVFTHYEHMISYLEAKACEDGVFAMSAVVPQLSGFLDIQLQKELWEIPSGLEIDSLGIFVLSPENKHVHLKMCDPRFSCDFYWRKNRHDIDMLINSIRYARRVSYE